MMPERNRNGVGLLPAALACLLLALPLAAQDISGGGGGGSSATAADIASNLVFHWAMEPGSCTGDATSVTDAGSAEENLSCTNTPQWTSSGAAVGSCAIDFTRASSEYCATGNSPGTPTGDYTLSVWLNYDLDTGQVFKATNSGGGGENAVFLDAQEAFLFALDGATILQTTNEAAYPDTWYHLVTVRKASVFTVWFNGQLVYGGPVLGGAFDFSTCPFYVGATTTTSCTATIGNYFDGQMDDFRVYSRALSATDIEALYALGN